MEPPSTASRAGLITARRETWDHRHRSHRSLPLVAEHCCHVPAAVPTISTSPPLRHASPSSDSLSSHRLADGPSTILNTRAWREHTRRNHESSPSDFKESRVDECGNNTSRSSLSPRSPVLQAEQEARVRAQHAAAVAQDMHDRIRLELDKVQHKITQFSSPRSNAQEHEAIWQTVLPQQQQQQQTLKYSVPQNIDDII